MSARSRSPFGVAMALGLAVGMAIGGCTSSPGSGHAGTGGQTSDAGDAADTGPGGQGTGAGGQLGTGGGAVGGTPGLATGGTGAGGASGGRDGAGGTVMTGSGGTKPATGGAGGRAATGGSAGGATATGTGGTVSSGGAGGSVAFNATDYMARKWARWPIPNPPSLSLPHPMSYADGADGVTDMVTGLVWQKSTNTATTTWQEALAYCQSLGAGWSLPTRVELTSILDNTQSGGKVNGTFFKFGNKAGWTWASTPWVVNARKNLMGDAALSWFINFSQGDSNNSLSQTAASAYARCVKLPAAQTLPAQHYTVTGGEVTDNFTGLVWQQADSGAPPSLTQAQAAAYCAALPLNGRAFRLPSLNELSSIVDDVPTGNVSPAVDHPTFPNTAQNNIYWSASSYGTSTTDFWSLNFLDGFTQHQATSTLGIARCVR